MPNFDYMPMPVDAGMEIVGIVLLVVMGIYLLMSAFVILSYVLQSLGMYTIAKRRGIHNPWLAWLPLGNMWILGSISDQYQYVAKGRIKNKRKILLGSMIAMYALMIPLYIAYFALMIQGIMVEDYIGDFGTAVPYLAVIVLCAVLILIVTVFACVIQYVALYDLYVSCDPYNAVTYLLLSIFINVTLPFFVFFSRKKDGGMPPRKTAQPEEVIPNLEEPVEE